MKNRQIILVERPVGVPSQDNFRLVETDLPELKGGEILVRNEFLSVDPYMRGRIRDAKSYAQPVQIGEVMTGGTVGSVVESKSSKFAVGDMVVGQLGWQEQAISNGTELVKFDVPGAATSTALGVLGMPGMTAYCGLLKIGQPRPAETVFVSGAAGAVGSLVGQIAKLHGCRVIGSAGTQAKVDHLLNDLGFDAAFNYKTVNDLSEAIEAICPKGIDVYFDNVGGPLTDAIFPRLNVAARVVICGQIDQYNATEPPQGPRLLWHLIVKRARVQGFLVFDQVEHFGEAQQQIAQWLHEGKIQYRETIVAGLENAPQAFIGLFHGANLGKQLVRL